MSLLRRPARAFDVTAARGTGSVPAQRMSDRGGTSVDTEYLRRANGHLRKSVIAFACVNQVMALPVAAGECFGRPLSHWLGLDEASAVVHDILRQDRSMAAWAARDCLVTLDALLHGMDSSWADALETAMTAAGLRTGPMIDPAEVDTLSQSTRDDVLRLANRVLSMFFAFERADGSGRVDRVFYQRLFAARSMSAALVAHDIAAWAAVVIGRLVHAGYLDTMLWMSPEFTTVPVMTAPGWHPNPFQMGEVVDGAAGWQRYWDGTDWTDRVRLRGPGGWHVRTKSMFEAPPN